MDLSEEAINRLRTLPPWLQEHLSQLNVPGLRRALGCASPCLVNLKEVVAWLTNLAAGGARAGEKLLTTADEVMVALGLPSTADTSLILSKIARLDLMNVIREAGLTDLDFAKLRYFYPEGRRSMSAGTTYELFTRYLNAVIPAKLGPNVERLRTFTQRLVRDAAESGNAYYQAFVRSSKGSMFENFVKMYVPEFVDKAVDRADVLRSGGKLLRCDFFVEATGEIWDFKNIEEPLGADEVSKYANLVGQARTTKNFEVKSVNFLFTTEGIAGRNWSKLTADLYRYKVWYLKQEGIIPRLVEMTHAPDPAILRQMDSVGIDGAGAPSLVESQWSHD